MSIQGSVAVESVCNEILTKLESTIGALTGECIPYETFIEATDELRQEIVAIRTTAASGWY